MLNSQIELRTLAAIATCTSSETESRYYLRGVCIEVERRRTTYIATDGHRMIVRRVANVEGSDDNTLLGSFIIPVDVCTKSFKLPKSRSGAEPMWAAISQDDKSLILRHGANGCAFAPIDATYPDWRRILPPSPVDVAERLAQQNAKRKADGIDPLPQFGVKFNPAYVLSFDKIGEQLGFGALSSTVCPREPDGPAAVFYRNDVDLFGVLMPMRDGPGEFVAWDVPRWDAPDYAPAQSPNLRAVG